MYDNQHANHNHESCWGFKIIADVNITFARLEYEDAEISPGDT